MKHQALSADPFNLIITGVGGQGNVLASKLIGNMLADQGFYVTIGETFGASQRGGSVMSHLRISSESSFSPQIPRGKAHAVVSLEPTEAIRVLREYGNPEVKVISNTRPVYSLGVICGDVGYPSKQELSGWMQKLTGAYWLIDATDEAVRLGNPILGNILLVGALAGIGDLPLSREGFREVMVRTMPAGKVDINLLAFDKGLEAVRISVDE
ncbi:MAG: indolepyruvate oxidoreductase subunit beta [Deltaproteobacteria bacterium]|jgi:indolepyruvate ferredoxin oxidoreductase beta subunit|nr:indolepyruvate oxidoreductase subunit beta [Deltaproteobacteria bacterium]